MGHGALADAPDGVDLLQVVRPNLLAKRRQVFNDSAECDGLELGLCEEVVEGEGDGDEGRAGGRYNTTSAPRPTMTNTVTPYDMGLVSATPM